MDNTQPLSKRSRRLLEEASRHLYFATKALGRLSIEEYQTLSTFCTYLAASFDLTWSMERVDYLGKAIAQYVREREQP